MSKATQLETLERLRQRRLQEAERALAEACRAESLRADQLRTAREAVAAADRAVTARRAAGPIRADQSFRGSEAQAEQRYLTRLKAQHAACVARAAVVAQELTVAQAAADAAREQVIEARREREVVSRHRARQSVEHKRSRERRAEAERDDLVRAKAPTSDPKL